jgi:hypothetical protein
MQYTHIYLLTKAWYIAQIFPLPKTCEHQLNTAIAWYIWHGEIFKVPLSTLQRPKVQGGWDLINIAAKSRTLYYYRLKTQGKKDGILTAKWLRSWDLHKPSKNAPNVNGIPTSMEYLRIFATESAYIEQQGQRESVKAYKRHIYDTIHILLQETAEMADMHITRLWSNTDRENTWKILHTAPVPETTKGIWYRIIHDIIPMNERLHKTGLSKMDRCRQCNEKATLQHRLIECGEGERLWGWTRRKIAEILRMDPRYIPTEWILRPYFSLWLPQRHRAVLWLLAQLVQYRGQQKRELTQHDHMDFLKRMNWKIYQQKTRRERVGNYLSVIDPTT